MVVFQILISKALKDIKDENATEVCSFQLLMEIKLSMLTFWKCRELAEFQKRTYQLTIYEKSQLTGLV